MSASPANRPPAAVAGYLLEEEIGRGGMAVVYRARDERLGRIVALKLMLPDAAAVPRFRERFIREIRAITIVEHPHVIPVYGAGEENGTLYIAMRLASGGDTGSLVHRQGPLPAALAASVICDAASALDWLHRCGRVHRDVKPTNLLLDGKPGQADHVYLADFGLSKGMLSAAGLTSVGKFVGTASYAAPEQITGQKVGPRADQYSLAGVACYLLTARPPYPYPTAEAMMAAHVGEPPPSVRALRPGLSRAVDDVIGRAMAKSPRARYRSCGDFAAALRAALEAPADATGPDAGSAARPFFGSASGTVALAVRPARRRLTRRRATVTTILVVTGCVVAPIAGALLTGPHPADPPGLVAEINPDATSLVGFTPAGLAFGPRDSTLEACVPGGFQAWRLASQSPISLPRPLRTVNDDGECAISPDGRFLAVADSDGRTSFWNVPTRKKLATIAAGTLLSLGEGPQMMSLDNEDVLATALSRPEADIWSGVTGHHITALPDPDDAAPAAIALSPGGTLVALTNQRGDTSLWAMATRSNVGNVLNPESTTANFIASALSTDGSRLAVATTDNTYVADTRTQAVIATIPTPGSGFLGMSPDGTEIARTDGTAVELVNVGFGRVVRTYADPGGQGAQDVAFSADGRRIAIVDANGTIYIWNA